MSIVTAESCTAGRLAWLLSEAPGAAEFLHGGYVAYTKANKAGSLGVRRFARNERRGLRQVALAMAQGALVRSPAQLAMAITGVAGPAATGRGRQSGWAGLHRGGLPASSGSTAHEAVRQDRQGAGLQLCNARCTRASRGRHPRQPEFRRRARVITPISRRLADALRADGENVRATYRNIAAGSTRPKKFRRSRPDQHSKIRRSVRRVPNLSLVLRVAGTRIVTIRGEDRL